MMNGMYMNDMAWWFGAHWLTMLLGAVVIVLPFAGAIAAWATKAGIGPALLTSSFHLVFNLVLALIFIIPLNTFAGLLVKYLPEARDESDPGQPKYLTEGAYTTPSLALSDAARETLRIGDLIETMLQQVMTALLTNDKRSADQVPQMDDVIDKLEKAVRLYITRLTREKLNAYESRRATEIISFAINLEHAGDIIDKNLMELASKKIKRQLRFSTEGAAELQEFHRIVRDNLKLAMTVFLSGDLKAARQLLDEKSRIRELEFSASENHMARLKEGRIESIETSSLHLDILRDLKRIHSHICAAAYPALEAAGKLQRAGRINPLAGVEPMKGASTGGDGVLKQGDS